MTLTADYIVVGSGVTGATLARSLSDAGHKVVVLERRSHVGGNVYDTCHGSGIRFHVYGPHYFWTGSERLWNYVNRFAAFYPFKAVVKCLINDRYMPWPIRADQVRQSAGVDWQMTSSAEAVARAENFEQAALQLLPRDIYERYVLGYTTKQWGIPPHQLSADLATRLMIRDDQSPYLRHHPYQGVPTGGFTAWIEAMLNGIEVRLGVDYLRNRDAYQARKCLIYTGAIDEFFGCDLGRLRYRAQRRNHVYFPDVVGEVTPCVQVNYPSLSVDYLRTVEWKYLLPVAKRPAKGTLITIETPYSPQYSDDYEYPFPSAEDKAIYRQYRERADAIGRLLICGRLGEYRYYDMDQAIGRALVLASRLLSSTEPEISTTWQ